MVGQNLQEMLDIRQVIEEKTAEKIGSVLKALKSEEFRI